MNGPLPSALAPLTIPASWIYERLINARNRRYDRGIGVDRLPVPVISVGNITTGGTGKTPMVMWIVMHLQSHGRKPAIAMRGYGATADQPSDESLEYAEALPDVPLIVNPDRMAASREHLKANPQTDCIILDDGFQHRRLHRDLDLVLIDASINTFEQRMIPAGHLREPLHNLSRADAVVVTRSSEARAALTAEIERYHGRPPTAWAQHAWSALRIINPEGGVTNIPESSRAADPYLTESPDWFRGRNVVTLLGVGNPPSIIEQLEAAGCKITANIPAGDHERFSRAKLEVARGLCDGVPNGALVMTQKDWVRCRNLIDLRNWTVPIILPQVAIAITSGREDLEQLIQKPFSASHAERHAAPNVSSHPPQLL